VDGTHAVSGVNAPIYLRFTAPLRASTVTAQNIKVFKLDRDPGGASENNRLGFQDVTGRFRFDYPAGSTGLWLYPRFPLEPGTHYLYLVTNRVLDAAGGFSILGAKAPSTTRMSFIGTSLGSIVGAGYLAGNAPFPADEDGLSRAMKGLLNVTGGRVVYLLKDSPAYGPLLDVILKTMNVEKDTPLAHAVLQLTQTVLDTVDPAAMTTPTAPDAPSRLSGRILIQEATSTRFQGNGVPLNGDLAVTNAYTRYLGDALGGREVLGLAQVRMVAPGFCQLGYGSAKRIPAPFLRTLEAGVEIPKTVPAARVGLGWGPGEGYFQFDQRGIHHGSLLEPGLMQSQALHWLESSLAVDPTP